MFQDSYFGILILRNFKTLCNLKFFHSGFGSRPKPTVVFYKPSANNQKSTKAAWSGQRQSETAKISSKLPKTALSCMEPLESAQSAYSRQKSSKAGPVRSCTNEFESRSKRDWDLLVHQSVCDFFGRSE